MRRIKVILYGVGAMNSVAARLMLEKGVDIVGALARSPEKVGRDLGDVAGLGFKTGVLVENDADRVFATRQADIAVIATSSGMPETYDHLRRCAENGVNAVTISEEALYAWNSSPAEASELDRLARRNGVTLSGTGHQDVFWFGLVSVLLGSAHRVDTISGLSVVNTDDFGPEIANHQQVNRTVEEFEAWASRPSPGPSFGRTALGILVSHLGLSTLEATTISRPEIAKRPMLSNALGVTVEPGRVIGVTDVDTVRTHQGVTLTFESTGRIYGEGEVDRNEWTITGEPELRLSNPALPSGLTTVAQLVNRIPDVINAPPGYVTIDQLPALRFRTYPLGAYLDTR
ncbi:dihydrodipicolinate reductase [Mycobacterium sp. CBMA293]|uniref:NAD(P)H-dependent amine dehydrogenase family protein n=1 Tax=unclassified Mycolicibacterium TaxID=2636767 RepID=UPI0012DBD062|nr:MULTISPECIES: dihydrodipicolinate reductase [unclassified Mycolicibacterium]MUL49387.1 dihydrodipicolinate reductase [Mycolicibacterium sp. CBMA 360]MUL62563.1 dihydrodipicolinate reductase [Mycolicibacterium sp. CBMA 335]MUL69015.1 dihydrodipicolinate reductase [Mycolicibacterium sp. CBMA 311]MUL96954.1 dihydrodipicolinate reductase [Mycolicibacterium sp. CBMA 230]MUM04008.1 dihydrodipicolinate reductase [Mycolicibacterium sp. CBMA 213]